MYTGADGRFNESVTYNANGSITSLLRGGMKNDGLILRGDTTLLWQFDGGYVDLDANGTPTSWNYYVTDHLGSTRMVVDSNDSIKEVINYYPFGSEMRMEAPAQIANSLGHPFRFTGKELDKLNGLNMYDFGARLFDVAGVPMWTSVDPLAEKYYNVTPYSYCAGDPVNKFDPDGRSIWTKGIRIGVKIAKQAVKNGFSALKEASTYTSAIADIKDNINTLTDANTSIIDKATATISLASEALPVSVSDAKMVKKTYQTYIKTNPFTKKKYVGRTSGKGTPLENIQKRDRNHHMNKKDYGPAELDKSSDNPDAIRGQEQYQIEQNGGAQSQGGDSGNAINGVSPRNPNREKYEQERKKEFGE